MVVLPAPGGFKSGSRIVGSGTRLKRLDQFLQGHGAAERGGDGDGQGQRDPQGDQQAKARPVREP
ncbi:hypothetical protein MU852_10865 [Brevundimonas albigilva]|uniref:hypothetical protein n=1 Tax=Brevundimonas albigilva TaxID=1312364 RepID=UPI00201B8F2D|nr:hypothetical protein [Brevundimonas albigilva]UQV17408.1 hypothetical protein MU852_10865 [Brevundimonas albigilva]